MRLAYWSAMILAAGLVTATTADEEYGVSVTGNGSTNTGNWTLGYEFTVGPDPIRVLKLGYFDDSKNGFASSHQIGVWRKSDQVLMTQATVTGTDPLAGFFRFAPITPVELDANTTYRVAGVTGSDRYSWQNPGFAVGNGITYNTDAFTRGGFAYPANSDGRTINNPAWFGGNICYVIGGPQCDPCDANCDGSVDLADIEPFIELLFGGDPCAFCTGDTNDDGSVDLTDVEGFIECLLR